MRTESNSFHLVDPSPWPLMMSTSMGVTGTGAVAWLHSYGSGVLLLGLGLLMMCVTSGFWFSDIMREGTFEGHHTSSVQGGLKQGVMLFMVSEVLFFGGFFFSYFWLTFGSSVELGGVYPCVGVTPMSAWEMPLLNTMMLLSSGASITWAHHSLVMGSSVNALAGLSVTMALALVFTSLQGYEYLNASFNISDSVYGSSFYLLTGFHGVHVMVGTLMMLVVTFSVVKYEQTSAHHFGFELSAYYWHFVDVVWLFLFIVVYMWGA